MKNLINKLFMWLLVALVGCSINAHSGSPWDQFFLKPDNDSLVELKKAIGANAKRCRQERSENKSDWAMELQKPHHELIVKGNESAFRAGLLVLRCLDGGALGDFYRSSGVFFEKQPHAFLTIVHEKSVWDEEVKYMIRMLPESTVDRFDLKILLVKKRIALLKGINDGSLDRLKKLGLSALEESLNSYLE